MRATWVCLLIAGCGVDEVTEATSAIGSEPIRVTAYHWGSDVPFAGAEVQFIAPDHSVQTVITDAAGNAEATAPANTRVVVFQDEEFGDPLVRVFDAANPGNHIIAGYTAPFWGALLGTVKFVLPPRDGWNNQQDIYYQLRVTCSPDNGWWPERSREVRVQSCPYATHATAVGWIEDGSGNLLTGASVLRDIDLTASVGGTIHMPAYTPKRTTASAQFVNVPAGTPQLYWWTAYFYGADPTAFAYGSTYSAAPDVVNSRPALIVGDRTVSTVMFQPPGFSNVRNVRIEAGQTASYAVDLAQTVRPVWFPTFDATTQTMHWNAAAYGQPASLLYAQMLVSSFGQRRVMIQMYAPGDTTSVTLPALPAALTPQPSDQVYANGIFYRIDTESYSQSMQVASSRDPLNPYLWSPPPHDVWMTF